MYCMNSIQQRWRALWHHLLQPNCSYLFNSSCQWQSKQNFTILLFKVCVKINSDQRRICFSYFMSFFGAQSPKLPAPFFSGGVSDVSGPVPGPYLMNNVRYYTRREMFKLCISCSKPTRLSSIGLCFQETCEILWQEDYCLKYIWVFCVSRTVHPPPLRDWLFI